MTLPQKVWDAVNALDVLAHDDGSGIERQAVSTIRTELHCLTDELERANALLRECYEWLFEKFRAFEAAVREIVSGMRNDTAAKPQLGYWADKLAEALQEQAE